MKSLIIVRVEDSRIDYTKLFEFNDCTVTFAKSGNTFSFDKHIMKSNDHLKLENFIFSDKNNDLYLIGRKVCEKNGILFVDLSGISDEQIGQAMDRTTNYVNGLVNGVEKWSVIIPRDHENCTFRGDTIFPKMCNHKKNVFKLCSKGLCPIIDNTE